MSTNSVDSVFEGKDPTLRTTFDYLLQQLEQFGAVNVAPKQTSIPLEKTAVLLVYIRVKAALI